MSTRESTAIRFIAAAPFQAGKQQRRRRPIRLQTACVVALLPATFVVVACFYVFVGWTAVLSVTKSRLLPSYEFVGLEQYRRLFASERWWTALGNLGVYAVCLIGGCMILGYALAVLIDRRAHWERLSRMIFMLPLAISFVVTGLVWQWLLNPTLGIERTFQAMGWAGFSFDWLVRHDRAIYTIAIAGIWQQTGMCMALFLAGMHGIDPNIWKATRMDGIPTWRVYVHVITPMLRPAFFTAIILLTSGAAKSYDLVVTLTGGGPGFSSDLPSRHIVDLIDRQELGMGAAGACMLLATIAAVVGPYLYVEMRRQRQA